MIEYITNPFATFLDLYITNVMYSRNLIYKGHKAKGGGWGGGRESFDYEFLPLDYS
jgi:hypothetical protein